jgi:hypothetical protein
MQTGMNAPLVSSSQPSALRGAARTAVAPTIASGSCVTASTASRIANGSWSHSATTASDTAAPTPAMPIAPLPSRVVHVLTTPDMPHPAGPCQTVTRGVSVLVGLP